MIEVKFRCAYCRKEWKATSSMQEEWQAVHFLKKAKNCRLCNRPGQPVTVEEKGIKA